MLHEDIVEVIWYYFVGFEWLSLALLWFRHSLIVIFLDTQQNEFPIYLGTYKISYFLPKLLESYGM